MTATAQTDVNLEELFAPHSQTLRTIRHYARKLVGLKVFSESDLEEVEQELTLRLLRRLRRFQAERSSLATFVDRAVRYEALEIFRTRCKPTHVRQRTTRSLESITIQCGHLATSLAEAITREDQVRGQGRTVQDDVEQCDLRHDVAQVINTLPADLQTTCRRLLEARNPRAAFQRLSPANQQRLRAHFGARGMLDYL